MEERSREDRFMEMANKMEKAWWRHDRMRDRIIDPMKALWFLEEDLEKVNKLVFDLTRDEPLGLMHHPTRGHPTVMLRERFFPRLLEALDHEWISYIEVPTIAVSAMPLSDQAIIRNSLHRWEDLIYSIEAIE